MWVCAFLFFAVFYAPIKEHIFYNMFGYQASRGINEHIKEMRAPIFMIWGVHPAPETEYSSRADSVDYYVRWKEWFTEFLYFTVPAIVLFGLTFVPPVASDAGGSTFAAIPDSQRVNTSTED
jgi:hypothetical protein